MRFMKKFLTLGFAAMAAVALSTGCQKKETTTTETTTQTEAPAVVEETGSAATSTATTTSTETSTTSTSTATTTGTETAPATAPPSAKYLFPRSTREAPARGPHFFGARPPATLNRRAAALGRPGPARRVDRRGRPRLAAASPRPRADRPSAVA